MTDDPALPRLEVAMSPKGEGIKRSTARSRHDAEKRKQDRLASGRARLCLELAWWLTEQDLYGEPGS